MNKYKEKVRTTVSNMKNNIKNSMLLEKLFQSFSTGMRNSKSKQPQAFLNKLKLDYKKLEVGFNSGQFHHRKDEAFRRPFVEVGILKPSKAPVNAPDRKAYTPFGNYAVIFPLRDVANNIVNFFAYRIKLASPTPEYLNDLGVYPSFPKELTERVFLVANVFEAATLLNSNALENRDAVLSLRNGVLDSELEQAIAVTTTLKEIVIVSKAIDKKLVSAVEKISEAIVTVKLLDEGTTLNDIWVQNTTKEVHAFLNQNESINNNSERALTAFKSILTEEEQEEESELIVHSPQRLIFKGNEVEYSVTGSLPTDLGSMNISLSVKDLATEKVHRKKLQLFDTDKVESYCKKLSEQEDYNVNTLFTELTKLTYLLENHREDELEKQYPTPQKQQKIQLTPSVEKEVVQFLSTKNLMKNIDKLLSKTGIIGEENTRGLLFIIASSFLSKTPLHTIVQASSGSGKSHLINSVRDCVPTDKVIDVTRVTGKSFYHNNNDELVDKLFVIQDFDGLGSDAQFAFRELQSAKYLSSSSTGKNHQGNHQAQIKKINAHFSSMVATTKHNIYYDNASRSVVIGIDESNQQTQRIIDYQNNKLAGFIDASAEEEARIFLQNCLRVLQSEKVINPFANQISLPTNAKMRRRLNSHFQAFIMQITLLNQYQRARDNQNRLITTVEDIEVAIELFFDAIVLKVDELTSANRQFFEELKKYVESAAHHSLNGEFTARELRKAMNLAKTQVSIHLKELIELEYVAKVSGSVNRGFKYKIVHRDNALKMREEIKENLLNQVKNFTKPNTVAQ